jgi:hypothetical protein
LRKLAKGNLSDRIIEWIEVKPSTFYFMSTEQLTITGVTFDSSNTNEIVANVLNTGTVEIVISGAEVTGNNITGAPISLSLA